MDNKINEIIEWLRERPLINIRKLERLAKIPQAHIAHVVKGSKVFSEAHEKKLREVLKNYGLK